MVLRRRGRQGRLRRSHGRAVPSRATRDVASAISAASCAGGGCAGERRVPRPYGVPRMAGGRPYAASTCCAASASSGISPSSAAYAGCAVHAPKTTAVPAATTISTVSRAVFSVSSPYAATGGATADAAACSSESARAAGTAEEEEKEEACRCGGSGGRRDCRTAAHSAGDGAGYFGTGGYADLYARGGGCFCTTAVAYGCTSRRCTCCEA
jgi:hypothetical protein